MKNDLLKKKKNHREKSAKIMCVNAIFAIQSPLLLLTYLPLPDLSRVWDTPVGPRLSAGRKAKKQSLYICNNVWYQPKKLHTLPYSSLLAPYIPNMPKP